MLKWKTGAGLLFAGALVMGACVDDNAQMDEVPPASEVPSAAPETGFTDADVVSAVDALNTTQIEEAVLQAQVFGIVGLAEHRNRQLLRLRQHLDLGGEQLDFARRQLLVHCAFGALANGSGSSLGVVAEGRMAHLARIGLGGGGRASAGKRAHSRDRPR